MTMKIGANDIFKVERMKNAVFQQFFGINMNTSDWSENCRMLLPTVVASVQNLGVPVLFFTITDVHGSLKSSKERG